MFSLVFDYSFVATLDWLLIGIKRRTFKRLVKELVQPGSGCTVSKQGACPVLPCSSRAVPPSGGPLLITLLSEQTLAKARRSLFLENRNASVSPFLPVPTKGLKLKALS